MSSLILEKPANSTSAASTWLRALELTASIPRNPNRILPTLVEEFAARSGNQPALISDHESLTYSGLLERQNQYARWALNCDIKKGDVVCLLMLNRPEYLAAWLGVVSIGGVVALLNTNLTGASLAHCINVVAPKHIIASADLADSLISALPHLVKPSRLWIHGADRDDFDRIDQVVNQLSGEALPFSVRPSITIQDQALYIYTSGTTGLPKAAKVNHARALQWCLWFAGMLGAQPEDRIYNCLPMYHSIGGVLVPAAALIGGGSVVLREKFSASQFWSDVIRWDCTIFQYIGELCRYLLLATSPSESSGHRLRLACGNGMAVEVWEEFQKRFQIPKVLEFYASTEGGVSLFNVEGKVGSIGRVPPYLVHRFSPALVKFDVEKGEPLRDEAGLCIKCQANEIGEALGKVVEDIEAIGTRFEGYTDPNESEKKILRNIFQQGDAWIRTGDLMRKDEKGFYYFVDRVGDTFRWKGENVATSEVSEAICSYPGIQHANVYGVAIPAIEGRAGMAALIAENEIDLADFRNYLANRFPSYARPIFLRLRASFDLTGTFKYSKTDLVRQGYNPTATNDRLYFDSPELKTYVPLDQSLYDRIQLGQIRL